MTSAPRISCTPSLSCPSPCPGADPNTTGAPSPSCSTACAAAPRSGPPHADFGSAAVPGSGCSPVQERGDGHCYHEDATVENRRDPGLQAEQLEPEDAGLQEVDADEGADRVEPSRLDDGSPEEDRGEGRQQETVRGGWVVATQGGDRDDRTDPRQRAGRDERAEPDPVDTHPRQAADLPAGPDEPDMAAQRGERKQIGEAGHQDHAEIKRDRQA